MFIAWDYLPTETSDPDLLSLLPMLYIAQWGWGCCAVTASPSKCVPPTWLQPFCVSILLSFPLTPRQGPGIPATDSGVRVRGSDVCKHNTYVSGAHIGQKVVLDTLPLAVVQKHPVWVWKTEPRSPLKQQVPFILFYWALSPAPHARNSCKFVWLLDVSTLTCISNFPSSLLLEDIHEAQSPWYFI